MLKKSTICDDIPLQHLARGAVGRVTAMEGDAGEIARLAALGIRQGVELCSLRKGCPCIVRVGCCRMCVRLSSRLQITVATIGELDVEVA